MSMGTKMSPSHANVCMCRLKEDFVYTYHTQPMLWKRFIDECFCCWTGSKHDLDKSIKYLNMCNPKIKFTHGASQSPINFLNTTLCT